MTLKIISIIGLFGVEVAMQLFYRKYMKEHGDDENKNILYFLNIVRVFLKNIITVILFALVCSVFSIFYPLLPVESPYLIGLDPRASVGTMVVLLAFEGIIKVIEFKCFGRESIDEN